MDDTISRQATIDAIDEIEAEIANGNGFQYEKWRKWFCELPSAQPERKNGKWIDVRCGTVSLWACSKCGEVYAENFHYCPNCGADMRKGENE